ADRAGGAGEMSMTTATSRLHPAHAELRREMPQADVPLPLTSAPSAAPGRRVLDALARWMQRVRHPRLVLVVVVAALYAPSLTASFVFDDYRNLRLMEEYRG